MTPTHNFYGIYKMGFYEKKWIVLIVLLMIFSWNVYVLWNRKEGFGLKEGRNEYVKQFLNKDHRIFPFRYFTDDNGVPLPFVAVTGFFRGKDAEDRYHEYIEKGINVFGITAYKSFPNRKLMDGSEGEYERNDTFDFPNKIQNWLCCFKDTSFFSSWNKLIDMSESDFYNSEDESSAITKTYDFIYICNKDSDNCPLDGWNAINRNFELAKKCFPIMCREFGLKGIVVGREGCGLEQEYGDRLTIVGWLDWYALQDKMRASKFLFVPNILDASPRVIAECLTKDVAVLMNRNILCGSKYVVYETGELFTDETDIRPALTALLNRQYKISPKKWWRENYSQEKMQIKLRSFLHQCFLGELDGIEKVKFIL